MNMSRLNNSTVRGQVIITCIVGIAMLLSPSWSSTAVADDAVEFGAQSYEDRVRFRVEGEAVTSIQVGIYNAAGERIYQGESAGKTLDWNKTSDDGERLTIGVYLYAIKAYKQGSLLKSSGMGKMYFSPDSVLIEAASPSEDSLQQSQSGTPTSLAPTENHLGETWLFGQVGVGTNNPGIQPGFDVDIRQDDNNSGFAALSYSDISGHGGGFLFGKARGSESSPSQVQNGDRLGFFISKGYDGWDFVNPAGVTFKVDGSVSSGSVPTKVAFETGTNYSDRQERLVVDSSGNVGIGYSDPIYDLDVNGEVYIRDDLIVEGVKNFALDDPADPTRKIYYAAQEGPEAGTYVRGTETIGSGESQVTVSLPEHFGKVTSSGDITVQLTPVGDWAKLYVEEKGPDQIVVRRAGDDLSSSVEFDFRVEGIREGYEDYEVYRDSR